MFWQVLGGQPVGRRELRALADELVPGGAGVDHAQAIHLLPELLWTDSLMMAVLLVPSVNEAIVITLLAHWPPGRL